MRFSSRRQHRTLSRRPGRHWTSPSATVVPRRGRPVGGETARTRGVSRCGRSRRLPTSRHVCRRIGSSRRCAAHAPVWKLRRESRGAQTRTSDVHRTRRSSHRTVARSGSHDRDRRGRDGGSPDRRAGTAGEPVLSQHRRHSGRQAGLAHAEGPSRSNLTYSRWRIHLMAVVPFNRLRPSPRTRPVRRSSTPWVRFGRWCEEKSTCHGAIW